jgi:hypothetical protein
VIKSQEFDAISPVVLDELKAYVKLVSNMYKSNPFHDFDHASHVDMSVFEICPVLFTGRINMAKIMQLHVRPYL